MADEPAVQTRTSGRKVRADTLAVSPEVVGQTLAEPWRRLAAMIVDLLAIGALSLLSGPFLGIAIGVLPALILGSGSGAPVALRVARWGCRLVGAAVVLFSALALGHAPLVRGGIDLKAVGEDSAAMKQTIVVPPNASYGQLSRTASELAEQVHELKEEIRKEREAAKTPAGRALALTGAVGVTFGWSGVYSTLLAGLLNGRTLGKLLLGIRAVKVNGAKFTYFDAFVRQGGYVAGVAMGMIGFLKLLWEPNRQTVEDRIAATVVVKV
ncbi:MAG: hypothetical protein RIS54_1224 [Verrucomicrobiota bacterium]|jgi:uncharacterized RDD family membrane protein YckC